MWSRLYIISGSILLIAGCILLPVLGVVVFRHSYMDRIFTKTTCTVRLSEYAHKSLKQAMDREWIYCDFKCRNAYYQDGIRPLCEPSQYPCLRVNVDYETVIGLKSSQLHESSDQLRKTKKCSVEYCEVSSELNVEYIENWKNKYGVVGQSYPCYYVELSPLDVVVKTNFSYGILISTVLFPSILLIGGIVLMMMGCREQAPKEKEYAPVNIPPVNEFLNKRAHHFTVVSNRRKMMNVPSIISNIESFDRMYLFHIIFLILIVCRLTYEAFTIIISFIVIFGTLYWLNRRMCISLILIRLEKLHVVHYFFLGIFSFICSICCMILYKEYKIYRAFYFFQLSLPFRSSEARIDQILVLVAVVDMCGKFMILSIKSLYLLATHSWAKKWFYLQIMDIFLHLYLMIIPMRIWIYYFIETKDHRLSSFACALFVISYLMLKFIQIYMKWKEEWKLFFQTRLLLNNIRSKEITIDHLKTIRKKETFDDLYRNSMMNSNSNQSNSIENRFEHLDLDRNDMNLLINTAILNETDIVYNINNNNNMKLTNENNTVDGIISRRLNELERVAATTFRKRSSNDSTNDRFIDVKLEKENNNENDPTYKSDEMERRERKKSVKKSLFRRLYLGRFQCEICDKFYQSPILLNCQHVFCELCLTTWVLSLSDYRQKSFVLDVSSNVDGEEISCPTCRSKILPTSTQAKSLKLLVPSFLLRLYYWSEKETLYKWKVNSGASVSLMLNFF
ncbi:hypothetical protein SNEBB_007845 [Seison nebaliae]|nr:hypothetical protein SNEBB_007845 [Seison nebaliae]